MNPRVLLIAAAGVPFSLWQLPSIAQCDTLDFEGYASDTPFIGQYQACGVVFSSNGLPTPPVTYDYGSTSWTSVLHSYDWYGELRMDFVDPIDGVTPVPVSYVSFDNPIDTEFDYIVGTVYDMNGNALMSFSSVSPDRVEITTGGTNIAYIVMDDANGSAYIIDNLVITGTSAAVREVVAAELTIVPTLASDFITVHTGSTKSSDMVLIASDGRIVQRSNTNDAITLIDVQHLASGTYTLVCNAGTASRTARFVKM